MKGRRSSDENYDFGYPSEFLGNVLPSEKEVVSHAHFLRRQNTGLGVWKQNTPDKEVCQCKCLLIYLEGLYFDGKKCDTLVRETKCVDVRVDHFHFSKKFIL